MAKHILIVDDTYDILYLMRMMLEEHHHQVSVLDVGAPVVEFVRVNRPDLIILDLRLTDISGITVLRELKADPDTSSVPVIAYTASMGDADKVTALITGDPERYGDTRVLRKPFAIDELLNIVA
ncbi:MAG: response regulator [Ktedonobacterales bacterium]|nr:response regulator [Ktedonobacterales bacterium]